MSRPKNKQEFTNFIKRKLGEPFVQIEVSPEQFDDIIDQALLFYTENIFEGQKNKILILDTVSGQLEYNLGQQINNLYSVTEVIDVNIFGNLYPTTFGLTQQDIDFLFSLGRLEAGSLVDFEVALQNISAIREVILPKIQWDFNFNTGIFRLETEPPPNVNSINRLGIVCSVLLDYDGSGSGKYWSNNFFIDYATALAKIQWGTNMKKFSGFNIPGGGQVNAQEIYQEGKDEKERLEQEALENLGFEPGAYTPYLG